MHRASVFEALGMLDHAKKDFKAILSADPLFIERYHTLALQYEANGLKEEARKIRNFLLKLYV